MVLSSGEGTIIGLSNLKGPTQLVADACCSAWACGSDNLKSYFDEVTQANANAAAAAYSAAKSAAETAQQEKANLDNGMTWAVSTTSAATKGNWAEIDYSASAVGEAVSAVIAHLEDKIVSVQDRWEEYTSTGVWTAFKKAPETSQVGGIEFGRTTEVSVSVRSSLGAAFETFGCSDMTFNDINAGLTVVSVAAFDACSVEDWMTIRKPFVSGVHFSTMLGGFDSFSLFLSATLCAYLEELVISQDLLAPPVSSGFRNDYILMLHGWGGDYSFLHLSAAVVFYATFGVASQSSGAQGFEPCNDEGDLLAWVAGGKKGKPCTSKAAPGGMMILSPDGAVTPLPRKNWWLNSEFTGHVMDSTIFELPTYILANLGFTGRAFGLYGCSAGGFGSFQVAMRYPHITNAVGAFNSPIFPQDCHFAYTCHHICSSNMMLCELMYTTVSSVISSYVILFAGSLVVSTSSTDPVSWGEAVHMAENEGQVSCMKGEDTILAMTTTYTTISGYKYITVDPEVEFGEGGQLCQYQDWETPKGDKDDVSGAWCQQLFTNVMGSLGRMEGAGLRTSGSSFSSGRWTFRTEDNFEGTNPHYVCPSRKCDDDFAVRMLPYIPCESDSSSSNIGCDKSDAEFPNTVCSQFHCTATTWCVENNEAAGASAFLDAVKVTAGIMKFVSPYHPVDDMPINSAWGRTFFQMPSVMFANQNDMWEAFAIVLLLHCSQNDEFLIFPMYIDFVSMLTVSVSESHWSDESKYIVDFGDCDYHHFSQRDMKLGTLFFSDALRTYSQDFLGLNPFTVSRAADFKLCFMTTYGFTPVFGSDGIYPTDTDDTDESCNLEWEPDFGPISFFFDGASGFPDMYTPEEWGFAMAHGQAQVDEEAVHEFEEFSHAELDAQANPCDFSGDLNGWKSVVLGSGGAWWLESVNPLENPVTGAATCSVHDFHTFGEGYDSDIGSLDGLTISDDFWTEMQNMPKNTDYYGGYF
jgi:hypothetical protein